MCRSVRCGEERLCERVELLVALATLLAVAPLAAEDEATRSESGDDLHGVRGRWVTKRARSSSRQIRLTPRCANGCDVPTPRVVTGIRWS